MSYVKTGLGADPGCSVLTPYKQPDGSCGPCKPGQVVQAGKCVTPTAPSAAKPGTDWGGVAQTGLQAIASIFGKAPAAPTPGMTYAPSTNYLPWIIGGAAVLGGVLLLTRRKKDK